MEAGMKDQGAVKTHFNAFLDPDNHDDAYRYAVVILNSHIEPDVLFSIWRRCKHKLCADGGANKLFDMCSNDHDRQLYIPDLIKGDLDSLRDDVRDYYSAQGTPIVADHDQNNNDLYKCLASLVELDEHPESLQVVILGAFHGRFDQQMAAFQQMFVWADRFSRMVLISHENSTTVLHPGKHTIHLAPSVEGPTCGLIPLGAPCQSVTTTGLRWNLTDDVLAFGGLVSTSNHCEENVVMVVCSQPLVWSVELQWK